MLLVEIIERVTKGETPPYRPSDSDTRTKDEKEIEIITLMKACWQEDPDERLTFAKIKRKLKELNKGM